LKIIRREKKKKKISVCKQKDRNSTAKNLPSPEEMKGTLIFLLG